MHKSVQISVLVAMAMAVGLPVGAEEASPALIRQAAATAGGQVVLESALFDSTNHDFINGFDNQFKKDGLHLKLVRYQSTQQAALYNQELRAGKVSADLLFFVEPSLFLELDSQHKLTPYCSPNFKDYRPDALTPDCSYFTVASYLQYIVYNTSLMKQAPTSWMDLVDPRWKGKVSIPDPQVGGGQYYFTYAMFKLFGKDWFIKARQNDDLLTQSHGVTENQVMSGERYFGVSLSVLVRNDGPFPGGKGAPIQEAFPKEGVPLLAGQIGITKGGPNPAGAKVFIDWVSSLEGQKQMNHNGLFSLRKDFTDREGDNLSKIHYLQFDPKDMEAHRIAYTKEAEQLLTAP
jgi:iron(III) transport system substrate-binding protein